MTPHLTVAHQRRARNPWHDFNAVSELDRRLGALGHEHTCALTIKALDLFGYEALLRPTWITVARRESSMSMDHSWFPYRWRRMTGRWPRFQPLWRPVPSSAHIGFLP